ncbi:sugar transferase [Fretibacter rubidus]|uniref:sugar transferase n=1 Tax=Fretibacter rubidus TaxID=570162 RepID=UPI00352B986F
MVSRFTQRFQAYYPVIKRVQDILVSGTLLLMLTPVLLVTALAVALTSKGPILFWSARTGYKGQPFMMPKFRTMTQGSKVMQREIATDNDISVTKVGHVLRKCSLDELPQLWSVLKGDMSLIGPRPLLVNDQVIEQRAKHAEIFDVKPGITGLAQVNGRNFITMRNKVRYDAFYANRVCMLLDMKIALRTFGAVIDTKLVK